MRASINLDIFKTYDIRGIYPDDLDEPTAQRIGRAFVEFLGVKSVAVGRDMRVSSQPLFDAFAQGVTLQGADVIDLGLTSTDELYFAVGKFGYTAGAMITASHNPKEYNGFILCREEAIALSADTGVFAIRDLVARGVFSSVKTAGRVTQRDVVSDFADHCLSFIEVRNMKPLRIVVDTGNGMGGLIVPAVFQRLPLEVIPLYFELDGTFPNHPASPIEPENMADLQSAVRKHKADLGAAFDGDADRVFITDERGELVGGDMVTALVAKMLLRKHPGSTILYNLICSRGVPELIASAGGNGANARRPLDYQEGHARTQRNFWRRAFWTLLFPRSLLRRLWAHCASRRARAHLARRQARQRTVAAPCPAISLGRNQQPGCRCASQAQGAGAALCRCTRD